MVLHAANKGATKTRIMYGAYLSYDQVREYLDFLQQAELLRHDPEEEVYKLTEKGLRFLSACDELNSMTTLDSSRIERMLAVTA